ncbi:MAG TPA: S8 family serine peptidase, partial [Nitrososphaera sp.]
TDVPTGKRAKRTIGSPGCTPSAITVGAVDKFNNVADFSSIGPVGVSPIPTDPKNIKPDVVAPGVDIVAAKASSFEYDGPSYGTKPDLPADLRKKYTFKSGTSMATPMVSGACALLIQAFRQANNLTDDSSWKAARNQPVGQYKNVPELVKHALMDTASKLRREEEYEIVPNASVVFGSGLVQINKSLERVLRSKAVLLPADQGETAAGRDLPYAVEDAQYPGHHDLRQVQEALRQLVDRQELTAKDANKIVTALQKISSDQVPALLHMIDWHVASGSITTNQLQQMAARKDPVIDVVIPLIKACSAGGGDIDISSVLTPVRTYLRSLGLPCAIGNCYAQTPSSSATGQMLTTSGLSVSSKQRARKVSTRLQ